MKIDFRSGNDQKGIALIVTLLLLVFVLTIVSGLFYRHQINLQKVAKTLTSEQAMLLLLSTEAWAQQLLDKDARTSNVDSYDEPWARQLPVLPVEGGEIRGCLRDYQSLFNINDLGWYTNQSWEEEINNELTGKTITTRRTVFKRLLALSGLNNDDSLVAAVVDWVDGDTLLVSPDSAEDNEYLLLKPPYRPANFPIGDISELALVMGFNGDYVYRLQNQLSTAPEPTTINVNTATVLTFQALIGNITPVQITTLEAQRPFQNLAKFYQVLSGILGLPIATLQQDIPPQLLSVNSNYFVLQAVIELGAVKLAYRSILQRRPGSGTRIYNRTVRYLPHLSDEDQRVIPALNGCKPSDFKKS